jgi:hypothetical protein
MRVELKTKTAQRFSAGIHVEKIRMSPGRDGREPADFTATYVT